MNGAKRTVQTRGRDVTAARQGVIVRVVLEKKEIGELLQKNRKGGRQEMRRVMNAAKRA